VTAAAVAAATTGVVVVDNCSKWYGHVLGVSEVSWTVRSGIVGLLGPNGAGKSTLMKMIVGLMRPTRGRVIAASNTDLEKLSASGVFRRDLLYRLNVIQLHLPPLRERSPDIPLLVAHFMRKHAPAGKSPPTIDAKAMQALAAYSWPGNVRELENVIERAITLSQGCGVTADDLPRRIPLEHVNGKTATLSPDDLADLFSGLPSLDELERRYIIHVLDSTGSNRKRTAEILGINRKTLYRMAARFEIELGLQN